MGVGLRKEGGKGGFGPLMVVIFVHEKNNFAVATNIILTPTPTTLLHNP